MAFVLNNMPIIAGTLSEEEFVEDIKGLPFVKILLDGDW